jgi:hypothetical protein
LSEYRARIQRSIELLDSTNEKGFQTRNRDALKELLPERETLVYAGQEVDVDNRWITRDIDHMVKAHDQDDKDKEYDILISKLKLLAAEIDKLQKPAAVAADNQDHSKIEEILSRHEFAVAHSESLMQRLLNWLFEKMRKFFSFVPQPGSAFNSVLRVVIIVISIAVAVMLIVFSARYFKRDKKAKKETSRTIFGEEITEETTAESLADAARKLAEQGEYRAAIRKLYVSLLFELERQGLLRLQASTTNREYLNKIRQQLGLFPVMSYLTDRFDYFWYGKFASSQSDFDDFFANYRDALNKRPPAN